MRAHIIYCHPSNKSYTYEILSQLKSSLVNEKMEFDISDLYAIKFKTDMSEEEYEREGFGNKHLPLMKDVIEEQKKIKMTDCLIFVYPVWWSDCPAKLKGWFDRVFSIGYAYGLNEDDNLEKMKTIKYGLMICTAGHPIDFLNKIGIAESMRNFMIDDRLGNRFLNKEMIILHGTMNKENVRSNHAEMIKSIGERIKSYCV